MFAVVEITSRAEGDMSATADLRLAGGENTRLANATDAMDYDSMRAQWKISNIVAKGDMSGDGRIDVSPDGKRLLLSIDMGEESGRKDWDGPLPALWAFDLQSQKATRLTPKKLFGWDGVWIDNDNILFLSRAAGEKQDSIYRMSTDGKNLKRLIKNARFPSVSSPQP